MAQAEYPQYRDSFFEGAAKLGQQVPQAMEAVSALARACVAEGALSTKVSPDAAYGVAAMRAVDEFENA